MNSTNNISARMSYDNAKDMFVKAFLDKFNYNEIQARQFVNGFKLTQGEVRCEVELNATSTNYAFGVVVNQPNTNNTQFNTERRLNLQDSLCVTEMMIQVGKPASRTSTIWQLRSYGNTQDFTAASANALDSTFYGHGWFTMKVNNDVIVPYRGLQNWHYLPQTQQTAALGAGSPNDQFRGAEDASVTCEPNLVLIGSSNIQPQIELPANLVSCDEFTRCVITFKGILAQNSTIVN